MDDKIPPILGSQPPSQPSYNEQSELNVLDSAVSPALATTQSDSPNPSITPDTHPPNHIPDKVDPDVAVESKKEEAVHTEEAGDQKAQGRDTSEISLLPPLPPHSPEFQEKLKDTASVEMTQAHDGPMVQQQPVVPPVGPVLGGQDPSSVNPKVADLKNMFPDFDTIVLQSVLDSVNGNQERAIEILLGMSDPSYVASPSTGLQEQLSEGHSLDIDEQLARQLAMEEEQVHRDGQEIRRHQARPEWQRRDAAQLQAQAMAQAQNQAQYQGGYAHANLSPNGQHADRYYPVEQGGQRQYSSSQPRGDFISDVADTFNNIAESGKKTFATIFGKAKARIDEYNARPAQRSQQYPQQPYPNQSWSPNSPPTTSPRPPVNPYSKPPLPIRSPTIGAPLDRHAASEAYQAQYFGGPDSAAKLQNSGWEQAKASWTKEMAPTPSTNGVGVKDPIATAASGPGLYSTRETNGNGRQSPAPGSTIRGYDVGQDLASAGSGGSNAAGGAISGSAGNPAPPPATVHGFDVRELGYALPSEVPGAAPTPSPNPVRAQSPSSLPRGSIGDVPTPPRTSTGSPIDASKLGLLPKRPVSLLNPETPASTTQSHGADDSSDDDELEYIENPFED